MGTSIRFPSLMAVALAIAAHSLAAPRPPEGTPARGPVSERSVYQLDAPWTDDAGASFRLASLRGRPVVIAMIFTSCSSVCPLIVGQMKELEQRLPRAVRDETRFVLVSFDPGIDTPPVLRSYRARSGLDEARWILLRGNPDQVRELAMVLGFSYLQVAPGLFSHASLVSILDRKGEIAYQRAGLQGAMAEAVRVVGAAR